MLNYIIMLKWRILLSIYETNVNELRFFSKEWTTFLCLIKKEETELGALRKDRQPRQESVCAHSLMHDDWSFIFSAPLRALSVCITAVKWTLGTKDVHGKRVGERVEEYASKHKHSRVGIYSKRISHLIKTSPQLPGGLCHTKRPCVKFGAAPQLKISVWEEKRYTYAGFPKHFTWHNWAYFFLYELKIGIMCVHVIEFNAC